jgi:site-specific recombinase
MSQKAMERNADAGEHYITKDRREFLQMFKRAGGGGANMSIAVIAKVLHPWSFVFPPKGSG